MDFLKNIFEFNDCKDVIKDLDEDIIYYQNHPVPSPKPLYAQVKELVMFSKYKDLLWPKDLDLVIINEYKELIFYNDLTTEMNAFKAKRIRDRMVLDMMNFHDFSGIIDISMAKSICEKMLEDDELIQFANILCNQLDVARNYASKIIDANIDHLYSILRFYDPLNKLSTCDPYSNCLRDIHKLVDFNLYLSTEALYSTLMKVLIRIDSINFFKELNCAKKWLNNKFILVDTTSYFLRDAAENASKFEAWLKDKQYLYSKVGDWITVVVRNFESANNFTGRFGLKAYFFFNNNAKFPDFDKDIPDFNTPFPSYGIKFNKKIMRKEGGLIEFPSIEIMRAAINSIYDHYQESAPTKL